MPRDGQRLHRGEPAFADEAGFHLAHRNERRTAPAVHPGGVSRQVNRAATIAGDYKKDTARPAKPGELGGYGFPQRSIRREPSQTTGGYEVIRGGFQRRIGRGSQQWGLAPIATAEEVRVGYENITFVTICADADGLVLIVGLDLKTFQRTTPITRMTVSEQGEKVLFDPPPAGTRFCNR